MKVNDLSSVSCKLIRFSYLEWVAIAVFGHLVDNSATITKLAHFATSPSVKTAFLTGMAAVILQEKLKVILIAQIQNHLTILLRVTSSLKVYHLY